MSMSNIELIKVLTIFLDNSLLFRNQTNSILPVKKSFFLSVQILKFSLSTIGVRRN